MLGGFECPPVPHQTEGRVRVLDDLHSVVLGGSRVERFRFYLPKGKWGVARPPLLLTSKVPQSPFSVRGAQSVVSDVAGVTIVCSLTG